jgi:hypothetical protein
LLRSRILAFERNDARRLWAIIYNRSRQKTKDTKLFLSCKHY